MSKSRIQNPTPQFLIKTYEILETPHLSHVISWSQQGNSFVLLNQRALTSQVLPHYFKHRNYSSFLRFRNVLYSIRQLNMYNFRKQKNELGQNEFSHKYFRRDCKSLLQYIKRRSSKEDFATNGPTPDLKAIYDLGSKSKEISAIQSTINLLKKLQSTQLSEMEQLLIRNDQMIHYYQELKSSVVQVETNTHLKFQKVNSLVTNILSGFEREGITFHIVRDKYSHFFKHSFLQRGLEGLGDQIGQLSIPFEAEMKQDEHLQDSEYSVSLNPGEKFKKQLYSPYVSQNLFERYIPQNSEQNFQLG